MATYKFDKNEYDKIFGEMFGEGSRAQGLNQASEIGRQIGLARLEADRRKKEQARLESALKEAAKLERERKEKEAREKASGRSETSISKENANKKLRIEAAGGSTEKPQSAIGKALNLDPDNNLFFDALDLLGRPLNAVNNVFEANAKVDAKYLKDGKVTEEDLENLRQEKKDVSVLGELWEGLSGKEKTTGSDIYKASGMKEGLGTTALGTASDMVLDPLNAVGGILGKGVTAGAKGIGALASKLPGADKVKDIVDGAFVGKRALQKDLAGNISDNNLLDLKRQTENQRLYQQELSKLNVAKAMLQGGEENATRVARVMEEPLLTPKAPDLTSAPNVLNSQSALDQMNTLQNLDPLAPNAPRTIKDINTSTTDEGIFVGPTEKWGTRQFSVNADNAFKQAEDFIVKGNVRQATEALRYNPKFRQSAQTLIDSNADLRKFASDNGIEIDDMVGYMAHFATDEFRKHLDETGDTISNGVGSVGGNKKVLNRKLEGSVLDANAQMRRDKGVNFEAFTSDAFLATAGGQQRLINYVAKESIKNRVLEDVGRARVLKDGQKARKGNVERTVDGQRYELTKGANDLITNFEKKLEDDSIKGFWKSYDKLTNMWKKTALFTVGFHARNFAGNNFNMYVGGMSPVDLVEYQTKAIAALEGVQARLVGRSDKAPKEVDKLYDQFLQQGLKSTGSTADFLQDPAQLMSDVRYRTKGALGKVNHPYAEIARAEGVGGKLKQAIDAPFQQSRNLGDVADETARFAMFMWGMDKYGDATKAAEKVREVLFDYTELTPFEQQGLKRVAPFYTWMRKNSEFQLKAFAQNPQRYERVNSIFQNAQDNTDNNQEIMPDYLKENFALQLPGTDKMLSLNLPLSDLAKMTDPSKVAMDSLSPLIKTPAELAFNQKTLNGAPITSFDTESGQLFGKEFEGVGPLNGKQIEYLAKNLLAPVRNLSGGQEKAIEGGSPLDILAQATGGNMIKEWDEEGFQRSADYEEKERLDNILNDMKKDQGIDVPTIQDLEKQGVYQEGDFRQVLSDSLADKGYDQRQIDMLVALKKQVRNNDAAYAQETATILQQMGLPADVIELIASDYLVY